LTKKSAQNSSETKCQGGKTTKSAYNSGGDGNKDSADGVRRVGTTHEGAYIRMGWRRGRRKRKVSFLQCPCAAGRGHGKLGGGEPCVGFPAQCRGSGEKRFFNDIVASFNQYPVKDVPIGEGANGIAW